ncbi:BTAD domain-containing putative transcriptional regulator [Spongiactinospora sp. 9N601]|uniref:AfsR/SARP family transcriptional regulator n=1 Tax=Spongiactinospora sp. 9N601 TaxID=3375149 RepID=UPI0037B72F5C
MSVEFRILGPIEVCVNGRPIRLGGPRPRAILVTLLLHANRLVRTHRVIDQVWPEAPDSAASNLRTYLSRLRRALCVPGEPESRLRTGAGGYLIEVRPGELDADAFIEQAEAGERASTMNAACGHFERALRGWRGRPLEDVPLGPELAAEAARLAERRDGVRERYFGLRIEMGQHAEVLPELRAFVAGDPLREGAVGLLMSALDGAGCRAAALELFHATRRRLIDELGVEPGADLRRLFQRLLTGGAAPGGAVFSAAGERPVGAVLTGLGDGAVTGRVDGAAGPRYLFVGRERELRSITQGGRFVAVDGMPGVGKTALAVEAARRLRAHARIDLTLSVDLHGYDRHRPPVDPAVVLDEWLRRFGAHGDRLQRLDVRALRAEFLDRLAGRRVLVLLDNAADERQVLPLIVDGPGSLTLVTSRRRLTGLPGADHVRLEVLGGDESVRLLRAAAGADRIDAEPDTAADIAETVGHLPLALGLVAGQIAGGRGWTLHDHLERLRAHRDLLRVEAPVEAAFALSYERLTPGCRRTFRLLALHPGRRIDDLAAAALAGVSTSEAARDLRVLLGANLLRRPGPDHCEFHDLTRRFALRQAIDREPGHARQAALGRLHAHYARSAALAMDQYAPYEKHRRPAVCGGGGAVQSFADRRAASDWLDTERANLVATAVQGTPAQAALLSTLLSRYLDSGGHYRDAKAVHARAAQVTCAGERGRALARLAAVHWRTGDYGDAIDVLHRALTAFRAAGDRFGEGYALGNLGMAQQHLGWHGEADGNLVRSLAIARELADRPVCEKADIWYERQGRHSRVLGPDHRTLNLARQVAAMARRFGDRLSEANALGDLGIMFRLLGDLPQAHDHLHQALTITRELGNQPGEADLLNELGETVRAMGDPTRALGHHQVAVLLAGELCDDYRRACALDGVALCHQARGEGEEARAAWRRALRLHEVLGTPEASTIRERLHAESRSP